MDLFTYGTLMQPAILAALTGREPGDPPRLARLLDHVVLRLHGFEFPGMIPRRGSVAPGVVHRIQPDVLRLLDAFEGELYCRREVVVELRDGGAEPFVAHAFLLAPTAAHLVVEAPWDAADFLRRRSAAHAAECRRFRRLWTTAGG